jgi:GNAT superfamily N-acetyltransferase
VSDLSRLEIRPAGLEDAEAMAAGAIEAFEGYRGFQPQDWEPPPLEIELGHVRARLSRAEVWARVACDGELLAGQILFEPARGLDAVAHVAGLFIAPGWWGTGLAPALHGLAVGTMRVRGYARARLFTPERQDRARRFYEREGWHVGGAPFWEDLLQMSLVEYRLPLAGG